MSNLLSSSMRTKSKERVNEMEMNKFLEKTQDLLPGLTLDRSMNSKLSPREVRIDVSEKSIQIYNLQRLRWFDKFNLRSIN